MLLPFDGRVIAYDLVGPGLGPVVCLTHALAADGGMWAEQVPALVQAGFRVLRIDMRGHGGSDPVAGGYSMSALAADVVAVLDRLSIARVHYVGLSIGGMIGQAFALQHRDRLISALWSDTLPSAPAGAADVWAQREAAVRQAGSLAPLADGTMERWLTESFKQRKPGRWQQIRDTILGTTPAGFLGCAAALQAFDFVPNLPSLALPVLVVCGADDAGTPPDENRRLAGLVPGARYEAIAAARHLPNIEQAWEFNRVLLGWLGVQRGRS